MIMMMMIGHEHQRTIQIAEIQTNTSICSVSLVAPEVTKQQVANRELTKSHMNAYINQALQRPQHQDQRVVTKRTSKAHPSKSIALIHIEHAHGQTKLELILELQTFTT